ncbi:hypothetical protein [Paraglaciecola aestuariivivens]
MAFNKQVDYIPNQAYAGDNLDFSAAQDRRFQSQKWRIFIGTFLLVLIVANLVIWTLPPLYQSQSSLHFSYASQTDQAYAELAQRQITMHQQRLKSHNVLTAVANELAQQHYLYPSVEELVEQLSVDASLAGRMITLTATGENPSELKPYLDAWIKVYLALVEADNETKNSHLTTQSSQQLALLEEKIVAQNALLEAFANENNITSLERDENRILSQTKNLANNLDQALADEAQAQALLNSVIEANNDGQVVTHPADKAQLDKIKSSLSEINANLTGLREKYTQAYLDRDPAIVAQQNKAANLKQQLAALISTSQQEYLLEIQRNLSAAKGKVEQLSEQLVVQDKNAQIFSQNLEQYKRLDDELKALQSQVQTLKNQQVAQEVAKPFEAQIAVLEPAYIPDYASAPNYLLLSLYSLAGALGLAILALTLFNFIFKQKTPAAANHFVVVPNQPQVAGYSPTQELSHNAPGLLTETQALPASDPIIRLLSEQECCELFNVANNQGKTLIGLVLSGVSKEELLSLKQDNFSQDFHVLQINNQYSRVISLVPELAKVLQSMCQGLAKQESVWPANADAEYFEQLLINAGHDGQLNYPEQLSVEVLRHTYLTFLVKQGCKLNDLELLAGHTPAKDIARYRQVNQQGKRTDIENIQTYFPFI